MPLDPESLILLPSEVQEVLPTLNPLDPEHRLCLLYTSDAADE